MRALLIITMLMAAPIFHDGSAASGDCPSCSGGAR
jgi:hypothetical protein